MEVSFSKFPSRDAPRFADKSPPAVKNSWSAECCTRLKHASLVRVSRKYDISDRSRLFNRAGDYSWKLDGSWRSSVPDFPFVRVAKLGDFSRNFQKRNTLCFHDRTYSPFVTNVDLGRAASVPWKSTREILCKVAALSMEKLK